MGVAPFDAPFVDGWGWVGGVAAAGVSSLVPVVGPTLD